MKLRHCSLKLILFLDCVMRKFNVINNKDEIWRECKNIINRYGWPSSIVQREVRTRMNKERARSMGPAKDRSHRREPSASDITRRRARRTENTNNMRVDEIRKLGSNARIAPRDVPEQISKAPSFGSRFLSFLKS